MKKCVRCGTRFDDSALKCPDCQLYLIKDTVGDMTFGDDTARTSRRTSVHDPDPSMRGSSSASSPPAHGGARPRRSRVEPVTGGVVTDTSSPRSRGRGSGFRPSGETTRTPDDASADSGRFGWRRTRSRDLHRLLRRIMPALRYAIPAALILISILFIVLHWDVVYGVIHCCIIGGIVGGILLTWLSAAGHHYSLEATIVGIIGGMVVSCILTYNLFDAASGLGALLTALGPCIITVVGILYLIRSLR